MQLLDSARRRPVLTDRSIPDGGGHGRALHDDARRIAEPIAAPAENDAGARERSTARDLAGREVDRVHVARKRAPVRSKCTSARFPGRAARHQISDRRRHGTAMGSDERRARVPKSRLALVRDDHDVAGVHRRSTGLALRDEHSDQPEAGRRGHVRRLARRKEFRDALVHGRRESAAGARDRLVRRSARQDGDGREKRDERYSRRQRARRCDVLVRRAGLHAWRRVSRRRRRRRSSGHA